MTLPEIINLSLSMASIAFSVFVIIKIIRDEKRLRKKYSEFFNEEEDLGV